MIGCNAVEDVREEPFTPVPTASVVLTGNITGLGTRRPLELQNNGANPKKFFGTLGSTVTPLDFGVLVGSSYNITVKTQPFSKICTVTNGVGTASATAPVITVSCVKDPAIARYSTTVTNLAVAAATPNLTKLVLTLETEDGAKSVDVTGMTSYTFPSTDYNAIYNSQLSVPAFQYKVSATWDTIANGVTTTNYCLLSSPIASGRPGMNITTSEDVVVPSAAVTMSLTSCAFTVAGTIAYSIPTTPAGQTAQTIGAMTLGLKNASGTVVQTVTTASGATTFTFPTPMASHSKAIYELVITSQPAGQFCVVSGTTTTGVWSTLVNSLGSSLTGPTASGVLLLDPVVPDWWAFANRNVRCRATPVLANQLTGIYQMDRPAQTDPAVVPARPREFLTFFADGTFLYGINFTGTSLTLTTPLRGDAIYLAGGAIHGFYNYNPVNNTIVFTIFTATNISPSNYSLTGMPGYVPAAAGPPVRDAAVTATNVVKTSGALGKLSLTFTGRIPAPVQGGSAMYSTNLPAPASPAPPVGTTDVTKVWNMTEPPSTDGQITGTWVTADHRRMFAYNNNEIYLFHVGVNGVGNLQDACFLADDNSTQSGGLLARHSSASGCAPGGAARTPDLPSWTSNFATGVFASTVIRLPTELSPRFPGAKTQLDNRPTSPIKFNVVDNASTPDTITVQDTLNGAPIDQPVTFTRYRAN